MVHPSDVERVPEVMVKCGVYGFLKFRQPVDAFKAARIN